MKPILSLLFVTIATTLVAEDFKTGNEKLVEAFEEIHHWSAYSYHQTDDNVDSYDSLKKYNKKFEALLLKITSSNPKSITYDFPDLSEMGLSIVTSSDGTFRVYSWNSHENGRMHFFRNIFQYKINDLVFSKTIDSEANRCYTTIEEVISGSQKYFITKSISLDRSLTSSHKLKIFMIRKEGLSDKEPLIKTDLGLENELIFNLDFTASVRKGVSLKPQFVINYDCKNKTILASGKGNKSKTLYTFTGRYFEKAF